MGIERKIFNYVIAPLIVAPMLALASACEQPLNETKTRYGVISEYSEYNMFMSSAGFGISDTFRGFDYDKDGTIDKTENLVAGLGAPGGPRWVENSNSDLIMKLQREYEKAQK